MYSISFFLTDLSVCSCCCMLSFCASFFYCPVRFICTYCSIVFICSISIDCSTVLSVLNCSVCTLWSVCTHHALSCLLIPVALHEFTHCSICAIWSACMGLVQYSMVWLVRSSTTHCMPGFSPVRYALYTSKMASSVYIHTHMMQHSKVSTL